MSRSRIIRMFASACLFAAIVSAVMAQTTKPATAVSDRPNGTKPLTATVAEESFQIYRDKNFGGTMTQVSEVTAKPSWSAQDVAGKNKDRASSLRWNLPRGVVVTLYENDDCLGQQITVWGSGEIDALSAWNLNDKMSSWAWNYVGGVKSPSKRVQDGRSERPKYGRQVESIPMDSLWLFKDRDGKGKSTTVEHVTSQPAGRFHEMPKDIGRQTSSIRWNLPEGVVAILAHHKNGEGPQVVMWGNGQFDAFMVWEMNDKIGYWAWYDIGEARERK